LGRVTIFLILIAAGGIAIAGGLGLAVSQAALTPVRRLTRATEKVAETRDLSERIEAHGEDELSRLAASFNTMLAALEESDRAKRDFPQVDFVTDLQPTELHGVPNTIARAVSNLLDNAAKWSPPGGKVEISVSDGQVIVRDHGPGIEDDDLPYVFDRFYRAPA